MGPKIAPKICTQNGVPRGVPLIPALLWIQFCISQPGWEAAKDAAVVQTDHPHVGLLSFGCRNKLRLNETAGRQTKIIWRERNERLELPFSGAICTSCGCAEEDLQNDMDLRILVEKIQVADQA